MSNVLSEEKKQQVIALAITGSKDAWWERGWGAIPFATALDKHFLG
jgi:hypothetical protein